MGANGGRAHWMPGAEHMTIPLSPPIQNRPVRSCRNERAVVDLTTALGTRLTRPRSIRFVPR
jgi:hypothetical protein